MISLMMFLISSATQRQIDQRPETSIHHSIQTHSWNGPVTRLDFWIGTNGLDHSPTHGTTDFGGFLYSIPLADFPDWLLSFRGALVVTAEFRASMGR